MYLAICNIPVQYFCECVLQSATSLCNLHRGNCLVGSVGMSTVMVMDAEPANHCVHGNSGEKNPSSSAHQMNMVLLWFWLSWLPPHRPGRCWTMDQLEFKCGAALGPALGAEPPHSGWSPCRDGCPLLPSHGLDHMQAFLPCPRGWIVAGMWEGTWWNSPFGMA